MSAAPTDTSPPKAGATETAAKRGPEPGESTVVYRTGRFLTGSWLRIAHRLSVRGREHLPKSGGVLVVANHTSFLDIPIIANAVPRHVGFVARDTLANSRFLGYVMRESGAILLKRGQADRSAIRAILTHLEAGDCVAVFPEGTRSKDGSLGEFRGGALLAARKAGVPLVPAAIAGAMAAYPRGATIPRPTKISVTFGPAIDSNSPDALSLARASVAKMLGDVSGSTADAVETGDGDVSGSTADAVVTDDSGSATTQT
ncbi:MAG: 1-acyl-sn-glycerol-3-phosphate acyltransferase [Planctomycetota bacterium]